mmetsp:Transcript_165192/g.530165  ORF Transcript_165192/g.530165 Transcript_165192/m.530165 type:complete len:532 (+) Transcript_165192:1561-3156(+)
MLLARGRLEVVVVHVPEVAAPAPLAWRTSRPPHTGVLEAILVKSLGPQPSRATAPRLAHLAARPGQLPGLRELAARARERRGRVHVRGLALRLVLARCKLLALTPLCLFLSLRLRLSLSLFCPLLCLPLRSARCLHVHLAPLLLALLLLEALPTLPLVIRLSLRLAHRLRLHHLVLSRLELLLPPLLLQLPLLRRLDLGGQLTLMLRNLPTLALLLILDVASSEAAHGRHRSRRLGAGQRVRGLLGGRLRLLGGGRRRHRGRGDSVREALAARLLLRSLRHLLLLVPLQLLLPLALGVLLDLSCVRLLHLLLLPPTLALQVLHVFLAKLKAAQALLLLLLLLMMSRLSSVQRAGSCGQGGDVLRDNDDCLCRRLPQEAVKRRGLSSNNWLCHRMLEEAIQRIDRLLEEAMQRVGPSTYHILAHVRRWPCLVPKPHRPRQQGFEGQQLVGRHEILSGRRRALALPWRRRVRLCGRGFPGGWRPASRAPRSSRCNWSLLGHRGWRIIMPPTVRGRSFVTRRRITTRRCPPDAA